MAGKAHAGLRWTLEVAAREIGMHSRTLNNALVQIGEKPDEDGKFTTPQILKAAFGDIESEKLRKVREEADKIALENARTRRELVPAADVERVWAGALIEWRNAIGNMELPGETKQRILAVLRDIPPEKYFEDKPYDGDAESDEAGE